MDIKCRYCGSNMLPSCDREAGFEFYLCPICLSQSAAGRRCTDPETGVEGLYSLHKWKSTTLEELGMLKPEEVK